MSGRARPSSPLAKTRRSTVLLPGLHGRSLSMDSERGMGMSNTRRTFLQSAALGFTGVSVIAGAQTPNEAHSEGQDKAAGSGGKASAIQRVQLRVCE